MSLESQEFFWKNPQGLKIRSVQWHVPEPKALIVLVHGQGEHIGRYAHVADFFNQHNIAVLGMDHQGYGRSEGKRGHAPSLDAYLDDIGMFLDEGRKRYPNVPIFLYGHSMGGHLALNYLLRRRPALQGGIITSPYIRLAFQPNALKIFMGKMLKSVLPGLTIPTGLAAEFISRSPEVVAAYRADPLVHGKVSAAGGTALIEGGDWLDTYEGQTPVPLCLLQGTGDKITSFSATEAFAKRVKGDVTFYAYPGYYHELHNEPERQEVFADILAWIQKHL